MACLLQEGTVCPCPSALAPSLGFPFPHLLQTTFPPYLSIPALSFTIDKALGREHKPGCYLKGSHKAVKGSMEDMERELEERRKAREAAASKQAAGKTEMEMVKEAGKEELGKGNGVVAVAGR